MYGSTHSVYGSTQGVNGNTHSVCVKDVPKWLFGVRSHLYWKKYYWFLQRRNRFYKMDSFVLKELLALFVKEWLCCGVISVDSFLQSLLSVCEGHPNVVGQRFMEVRLFNVLLGHTNIVRPRFMEVRLFDVLLGHTNIVRPRFMEVCLFNDHFVRGYENIQQYTAGNRFYWMDSFMLKELLLVFMNEFWRSIYIMLFSSDCIPIPCNNVFLETDFIEWILSRWRNY